VRRPPERVARPLRWTPRLVLGFGLVVTALLTSHFRTLARMSDELRFRSEIFEVEAAIQARLQSQVALLRGVAGLFASRDRVRHGEFRAYVERLDLHTHYPGVQGLGFLEVFPRERLGEVAANSVADGAGPLALWPETSDSELSYVKFIEPMGRRNQAALGFDMSSEPARRAGMDAARDTGLPSVSGRVTLVQEIDPVKQAGVVIFLPIYRRGAAISTVEERRAALVGHVFAPVRAGDLLQGVLGAARRPLIKVEVFDGPKADPAALLRTLGGGAGEDPATPGLAAFDSLWGGPLAEERTIRAAGRPWTLAFSATEAFENESADRYLALLLLVGAAASLGLSALSRVQIDARLSAEAAAGELKRAHDGAIAARREAEEASRLKDEFLATLSHELRTPLNAMLGWMSMLQSGAVPEDERDRALATIARNGRALAELVDDLLDVSGIVTGKLRLRLEVVDGAALIEDAVAAMRPTARKRRVSLNVAIAPGVGRFSADPARLRQIVGNLLSNAIKFTQPEGRVTVAASRQDDSVVIEVSDTGRGVSADFLPHLFQRFRQADSSTTRAQGGLGLGLSIVRDLVELHGGQVRAESEGEGKGARFVLSLPASTVTPSLRPMPIARTKEVTGEQGAGAGDRPPVAEPAVDRRRNLPPARAPAREGGERVGGPAARRGTMARVTPYEKEQALYATRFVFRRLAYVGAALCIVLLAYVLRGVLLPLFLAFLVAYALDPLVERLSRVGVPRAAAALLLMLIGSAATVAFFTLAVPYFIDQFADAAAALPDQLKSLRTRLEPWIWDKLHVAIPHSWSDVTHNYGAEIRERLPQVLASVIPAVFGTFNLVVVLAGVLIIPVFALYLLMDFDVLVSRISVLVPRRYASVVHNVAREVHYTLGRYVRGQLIASISLAMLYSLGLWALDIRLAVPIGLLTGLLAFVPYVGFGIGLTLALAMTILDWHGAGTLVGVVVVMLAGQLVDGLLITPRIVGGSVGLKPIEVLLTMMAAATLFGFVGVLLAVPLGAVVKILLVRATRAYLRSHYYRQIPAPSTPTPLPGAVLVDSPASLTPAPVDTARPSFPRSNS
jgi:signal transduction histidine kinase/predicted PurR-regulated permease PerM